MSVASQVAQLQREGRIPRSTPQRGVSVTTPRRILTRTLTLLRLLGPVEDLICGGERVNAVLTALRPLGRIVRCASHRGFSSRLKREMNVLVYNGPGTSSASVAGCVSSLTALLSPFYAVRLISPAALLGEPWARTTSLLVVPGGRDLPYCAELDGAGNRKIDDYVRRGGRYLGLCAGAYYASERVEFEMGTPMAVGGPRELGLWHGVCRGGAFPGFVYDSEAGARVVDVELAVETAGDARASMGIYWNGGGVFVDAEGSRATVLARYLDSPKVDGGRAAVISLSHGSRARDNVVLSALHPEISPAKLLLAATKDTASEAVELPSAISSLDERTKSLQIGDKGSAVSTLRATPRVKEGRHEEERFALLRLILSRLGLTMNETVKAQPELSTLHLLSYSNDARKVLIDILDRLTGTDGPEDNVIKAEHDTFKVITDGSQRPTSTEDGSLEQTPDEQVKYISTSQEPPEFQLFNTKSYFTHLQHLHDRASRKGGVQRDPVFGSSLLYAETVTSSQSLLDKNFSFQRQLPQGFTILCSHQISGRGRGQNAWINPAGVLSFSTILHHTPQASERSGSIIFIQYLVSLAVTDAIAALRPSLKPRIKWPNDIYLEVPSDHSSAASGVNFSQKGKDYAKISGSLITTSYYQGKYIMTIGVGINVSNPHPTTSINSVLSSAEDSLTLEELFAAIMVRFSTYYTDFQRAGGSFSPFESRYYDRWLHSEQQVTIEQSDERGVIVGLNLQNGTLRVSTDRTELELQADGNSFDMMKGLLKVKK